MKLSKILLAYFFLIVVVGLAKTGKILKEAGYYFDNVDVVQISYVSTKLYNVIHIDYEPRRQSVWTSTKLDDGIESRLEVALAVNEVQFLQNLKPSDVLRAQYSKTKKNEYVYEGLYINDQPLEDVYYQRMPARWKLVE